MTDDWMVAEMSRIPNCDFCTSEAVYDAATKMGPWAYLCEQHFESDSTKRLGLGFGQRLVKV